MKLTAQGDTPQKALPKKRSPKSALRNNRYRSALGTHPISRGVHRIGLLGSGDTPQFSLPPQFSLTNFRSRIFAPEFSREWIFRSAHWGQSPFLEAFTELRTLPLQRIAFSKRLFGDVPSRLPMTFGSICVVKAARLCSRLRGCTRRLEAVQYKLRAWKWLGCSRRATQADRNWSSAQISNMGWPDSHQPVRHRGGDGTIE